MINLLSNETKNQLKAARINSLLLKILIITLISGTFLAGAILFSMSNSSNSNQAGVDEQYAEYEAQAAAIDSKVADARSVISGRINFSEIILAISASLPSNITLDSIALSSANINNGSSVEFSAKAAKGYVAGSLKTDPGFQTKYPNMFSGYQFISEDTKNNLTTLKFSIRINYSRGL